MNEIIIPALDSVLEETPKFSSTPAGKTPFIAFETPEINFKA